MEGEEEVEVGLGSVRVSRATVAAVRGGLVSRAELQNGMKNAKFCINKFIS